MSNPPRGERVQKVIARSGLASRRKAEEWIRAGRVTLNGKVCSLGDRVVPDQDWLKVDGRTVSQPEEKRYLLLNKPSGYLATVNDPEGRRTVLELVPPSMRRALFPVGRLDYQTEGLLLLTTDGEWANKVAHPRYGCVKTYQVKVRGVPSEAVLERLRRGIVLEGRRTSGCHIESARVQGRRFSSKNSWWTVQLEEGRNRQIRNMFQQVGHPVMRIRRIGIGPLTGSGLPVGACRELDVAEVEALGRESKRGTRTAPTTARAGGARTPRRKAGGTGSAPSSERSGKRKPGRKKTDRRPRKSLEGGKPPGRKTAPERLSSKRDSAKRDAESGPRGRRSDSVSGGGAKGGPTGSAGASRSGKTTGRTPAGRKRTSDRKGTSNRKGPAGGGRRGRR